MTVVFGKDYADAYDLLYADKDYEAECDVLEDAFRRSGHPVRTVLDLGCGTGRHSTVLAERGYTVTGVDISEEMLRKAHDRATAAGPRDIGFILGDVRTVSLQRTFDAVICMFAVLGYQTSDKDISSTLATVRRHLAPAGPFIFDVWYGPAVEAMGPDDRVKVISTADGELERRAWASLERETRICTVSYRLTFRPHQGPMKHASEVHRMRYFFLDELRKFVDDAGMSLVELRAFPDTSSQPSTSTWNVVAAASG